ncbi:hypothetical protein PAMP_007985 [Pampus punctatissimus]
MGQHGKLSSFHFSSCRERNILSRLKDQWISPTLQTETGKMQLRPRPSRCASGLRGERAFHISRCMDCYVCKGALVGQDGYEERPLRL